MMECLRAVRRRSGRLGMAAGLLATLLGCGGGGGSSGAAPPAPAVPDGNLPLALSSSNIDAVASDSTWAAETMLRLAQFAANEVARVARAGALQFELACPDLEGGLLRYTLEDLDGNLLPSAGDRITIRYTRCLNEALGESFDAGTLTLHLSSVGDADHGVVAGTVDFGAGLSSPLRPDGSRTSWFGSLRFNRTETLLREELGVSASAADDLHQVLRQSSAAGVSLRSVAYQQPAFTRVLDREAARIQVTGSMRLSSERLGGRVDIGFEPEFAAPLGSNADTGAVRITGALNARITVPASPATESVLARLDTNGDGVDDASIAISWKQLLSGFLWSERSHAVDSTVGVRDEARIRLLSLPEHSGLMGRGPDVSRPLRLQFDRPLSDATQAYFRMLTFGSFYPQSFGVPQPVSNRFRAVPIQVSRHGAVLLIEPQEALRHGHSYEIHASGVADLDNPVPLVVHDRSGGAVLTLGMNLGFFTSDGLLWPAVAGVNNSSMLLPGRPVTVSATLPFAGGLPLRYRWSQLSGPPLLLGTPEAASTTVQLADGAPAGVARAMLQLTVSDAAGRTTSEPVEMQAANPAGVGTLLYFASSGGDWIGQGETHAYTPQTGRFGTDTTLGYLTVNYQDSASAEARWALRLAGPGGVLPAVGDYGGSVGLGVPGGTAPMLEFSGSGRACGAQAGSFRVLELELDAERRVLRLAADFEQACNTNVPGQLHGAIRINSSLPFQP